MAASKAKFSIAAAATPNRKSLIPREHGTTIPRASTIVFDDAPKVKRSRVQEEAPVIVSIYKYSDCGADLWSLLEGTDEPLWQVQCSHTAKPTVFFMLNQSFNAFLKSAGDAVPTTIQDLQKAAGIKLVLSDQRDPYNVGFEQWRVAFYVGGNIESLKNFLILLDDFFVYKAKQSEWQGKTFEVEMHPHVGVDISGLEMQYEHVEIKAPKMELPLPVFKAQPVASNRVVVMILQPDTDDKMSVLVGGSTWGFKQRLSDAGIRGSYIDQDRKEYYYVLKNLDPSEANDKDQVLQMISGVFNNIVIKVTVDGDVEEDSSVEAFIDELKLLPNLHFV